MIVTSGDPGRERTMNLENKPEGKKQGRLIELDWHRLKKAMEKGGFQAHRDPTGRHTVLVRFPSRG